MKVGKGCCRAQYLGVFSFLSSHSFRSCPGDGYTIIKVFIEFIVESFQLLIVEYNCGNYQTFVSVMYVKRRDSDPIYIVKV